MNDAPETDGPAKAREDARRKLMGRAMVIGFLALVAVYARDPRTGIGLEGAQHWVERAGMS